MKISRLLALFVVTLCLAACDDRGGVLSGVLDSIAKPGGRSGVLDRCGAPDVDALSRSIGFEVKLARADVGTDLGFQCFFSPTSSSNPGAEDRAAAEQTFGVTRSVDERSGELWNNGKSWENGRGADGKIHTSVEDLSVPGADEAFVGSFLSSGDGDMANIFLRSGATVASILVNRGVGKWTADQLASLATAVTASDLWEEPLTAEMIAADPANPCRAYKKADVYAALGLASSDTTIKSDAMWNDRNERRCRWVFGDRDGGGQSVAIVTAEPVGQIPFGQDPAVATASTLASAREGADIAGETPQFGEDAFIAGVGEEPDFTAHFERDDLLYSVTVSAVNEKRYPQSYDSALALAGVVYDAG